MLLTRSLAWILALALAADVSLHVPRATHPALAAMPSIVIWAWERPEDLRWVPPGVAIAYVAESVLLQDDAALVRPRLNPLRAPADAVLIPVLHVDASSHHPPALTAHQREVVVAELLRVTRQARRQVVQLDFEVRQSQRGFLADVTRAARARLDPAVALSMTALASWCLDDPLPATAAADEVVPMAFRMGIDAPRLRQRIADRGFRARGCAGAVGFSSDEPLVRVAARRRYYFSPTAWNPERLRALEDLALPST